MKASKEIRNQITANTAKAAELEAAADKLLKKAEKAAAATWGELKAISASIIKEDEDTATKLYTEAEELKSVNKILQENEKAAFCEEVTPIIKGIMQKYNGKQYGEKTRQKISDAAHAENISFYFDGYRNRTTLHVYTLTSEGYKAYNGPEVIIYARTPDNKQNAEFISEKNTIQDFSSINFSYSYTYTENPTSKRAEIEKAYKEFEELVNLAKQAESKLNSLMPDNTKHFNVIGYLSPHTKLY